MELFLELSGDMSEDLLLGFSRGLINDLSEDLLNDLSEDLPGSLSLDLTRNLSEDLNIGTFPFVGFLFSIVEFLFMSVDSAELFPSVVKFSLYDKDLTVPARSISKALGGLLLGKSEMASWGELEEDSISKFPTFNVVDAPISISPFLVPLFLFADILVDVSIFFINLSSPV